MSSDPSDADKIAFPSAHARRYDFAHLEAIVDASPDPIFIKDQACRYTLMNQPFLDVCGFSKDALGKTDSELFSEEFVRTVRQNDEHVLKGGLVLRIQERLFLRGAWRLFQSLKFPLRNENGDILAMGGIATDITERHAIELENSQLQVSEQAAKEASNLKSAFLATVSHEMRTPLAGIIGLVDLLLDPVDDTDATHHIKSIGSAAHGLIRIVNDILDLSKLEAGKVNFEHEPFNLMAQLQAMIATLQPSARIKNIDIILRVDPKVPPVLLGDGLRLQQVLTNLVGNAIKFSQSGDVILSVQPNVSTILGPDRVDLKFSVQDSGIGIAPENIGKIFLPFSQADDSTSRRFGGTGLGLSICRALVTSMGGTIAVSSTLGRGTTFSFSLRLDVGQEIFCPTMPDVGIALEGTVLLVEDNMVNQTVVTAMLKKIGVDVVLAPDGETAVNLCSHQDFNAVLMDCHMPGIDGLEATRRIRSGEIRTGHLPIIALTANAMPNERAKCLESGMNDYLTKPVKMSVLSETLRRHMRQKDRRDI